MYLTSTRRKTVWGTKRTFVAAALVMFGFAQNAIASGQHTRPAPRINSAAANSNVRHYRLDQELSYRADHHHASVKTRAIVTLQPGAQFPHEFERFVTGRLDIINGYVVNLPNGVLRRLAGHASVFRVHYDRRAAKFDYRTSLTVGSLAVNHSLGFTGAGVGVAVIDSGIATWHDDLTSRSATLYPYGNQRVSAFVDFVNGALAPSDDNGHGTHVAGVIAGNGYDSNGNVVGVAPDASLVSLKVLGADGTGSISNVIAALDWVLANHATYNIRVVNLSVGAAVHESYWTDPLTLAAKRVVDAGVVVVSAAGNFGKNAAGLPQYGGINAPGNAPWVLTVGASTTNGTVPRGDDTMASFSSRGPTYLDWAAKPDLVAPGVGTVSLADPNSAFYVTKSQYLLPGSVPTGFQPYLSLSGTSMAAPVVSGTIALMLQANPSLTPNAVKALLQYTAQMHEGYDPLTEGAGFLNTLGAVRLAHFYATAQPGQRYPVQTMWGKRVIWGNHMLTGGVFLPNANAWSVGTTWGVAKTSDGDNIVWGTVGDGDNIVWGTASDGDNIVWGTASDGDNIVWGTAGDGDNIVWGTAGDGDNIVWGTSADGDNIVWGTDCGGADCDSVVWGTSDGDNIVWGTASDGDNIVWGTADGDNIVWGTAADGDNIVWGTADGDNIVWGTSSDGDNIVWGTDADTILAWTTSADGTPVLAGVLNGLTDEQVFALLSQVPTATPPTSDPTNPVVTTDPMIIEPSDPAMIFPVPDPPIIMMPFDPSVIEPSNLMIIFPMLEPPIIMMPPDAIMSTPVTPILGGGF
jgi:serine protease AprX